MEIYMWRVLLEVSLLSSLSVSLSDALLRIQYARIMGRDEKNLHSMDM